MAGQHPYLCIAAKHSCLALWLHCIRAWCPQPSACCCTALPVAEASADVPLIRCLIFVGVQKLLLNSDEKLTLEQLRRAER